MISVSEAKNILDEIADDISSHIIHEKMALSESLGRVLAKPILSPLDSPLFDNSAMDGFALRSADTLQATINVPVSLKINGEIKAGDLPYCPSPWPSPTGGEGKYCVRIMTGAPVPEGCDAVVMKEKVLERDGNVYLTENISQGKNIRKRGEDIKKGDLALDFGAKIRAGTIGFLASLGVQQIEVSSLPRISILVTGNELVETRENLSPGKIFDSNSWMLTALLKEKGFVPQRVQRLCDDKKLIRKSLEIALEDSQVLILTGGVSVGDSDFTKSILADLGVETLFWKVNQKPGKPLYVGRLGEKIIFGLPGNPYAAFVCFIIYVLPLLQKLIGEAQTLSFKIPLAVDWNKKEERFHFLKGKKIVEKETLMARPLSGQGSHELKALTESDLLICLSNGARNYQAGELVEVLCL